MIVAVGAVFVALVKLLGVFPEALLALLASEGHIEALEQSVIFGFSVAFGAIEPFAACVGSLSGRKA